MREFFFAYQGGSMDIIKYGLYTIKDSFFEDFKNDFLVDNKAENRPNFCAFIEKRKSKEIIWFIPMSTRTDTYQKKIEKDEAVYGNSIFYHIGKVAGKKRVFLIGNMFPVVEKYIKQPYTLNDVHYVINNKTLINVIHKKATKYLALVRNCKLKPNVDILEIENKLLKEH